MEWSSFWSLCAQAIIASIVLGLSFRIFIIFLLPAPRPRKQDQTIFSGGRSDD